MKRLQREDVIGREIIAVYAQIWTDEVAGNAIYYFGLDSGILFRLPAHKNDSLKAVNPLVPDIELVDERCDAIHGSKITRIMVPVDEDSSVLDSSLMELSSGAWVYSEDWGMIGAFVPSWPIVADSKAIDFAPLVDFWPNAESP